MTSLLLCQDDSLSFEDGRTITNFAVGRPLVFQRPLDTYASAAQIPVFHLGRKYEVLLDLNSESLVNQITDYIPTCKILRPIAKPYIDTFILELVRCENTCGLYFDAHGLHRLSDGRWVFVCGNEVIGLDENASFIIAPPVAQSHLIWDCTLEPRTAVAQLFQRMEQDDAVYFPVWGFTLLSSLRSRISKIGLSTLPCLGVIGGQNFGKTTLVQRFCLLYSPVNNPERYWGQIDASSTVKGTISEVAEYRDQVLLVDDMAKCESSTEARIRKELISSILRFSSNDVLRVHLSSCQNHIQQSCTAGVAFTGELHLSNPSDISRLFVVDIDHPMSCGCSMDRTLAATAFYHFMKWLLPQLDVCTAELQDYLDNLNSGDNLRLRKNRILLLWVLSLFTKFALEVGAISEGHHATVIRRIHEILDYMVSKQIQEIQNCGDSQPCGNIPWYIYDGYRKGKFQVRTDRKHLEGDCCLVEKGALCIRMETLLTYLITQTPYKTMTEKSLGKELRNLGICEGGAEKRTASKKIHGQRYLAINIQSLKQAIQSY